MSVDRACHRTPSPLLLVISTKRWTKLAWTVLPGGPMEESTLIVNGAPTVTTGGAVTFSTSRPGPVPDRVGPPGTRPARAADAATVRHAGCISARSCRFLLSTQAP